jgi:hypothetical protein
MDIVVTDFTDLKNGNVCIAGIDLETGRCIRPLPHLSRQECQESGVTPRRVLRGNCQGGGQPPHVEDRRHAGLAAVGWKTEAEFRELLNRSCSPGVCAGFGCELPAGEKHYPRENPPGVSIVTATARLELVRFQDGDRVKLKCNLTDASGRLFRYLPVADLLLREYVLGQADPQAACRAINRHLAAQEQVLCRIGLGQPFRVPDGRDGYWLQLNGVYSFPVSWREGVGA